MYHAIVRRRVRALWKRIGAGEYQAAVDTAAPDLAFRFIGDNPLGAELTGPDAFGSWFAAVYERFPGLRFELTDVVVQGWPWLTTVVVKLRVTATLVDGSPYDNHAIQWLRLRWGRMVFDEVLEDTKELERACRIQEAGFSGS